ncbi:ankyrin repeat domain-containing protein 26 [Dendroctonus ponderosae]|uniref:ankyrin repeat domain-containing protein 26 n=1 Tax=Dendroctonus ponderosae TaxID=77166 RepID=UPI00203534DF|nr:ankyrin repeat domain-containing protein 26 [Dendroctonus ponderosae]
MDLHDQSNVGNIVQSIFSTCDIDNIDLVPVSKLIEFIRPYLLQDLEALENLQLLLDPFNTEALITSEQFCEVMTNWCQTLASPTEGETENSEFNKTPCNPASIDMLDLPYTHSTPRASLGDKLALRCKDLLNLSNVSGYSLSTSRVEECEPDKTILEEENKMLKQQLSKTSHELLMIKQQLAASEDINEQLQQDLGKANRILQQEQQANEHLTKDIKYSEDLRDELSYCKKHIGQLKSKLEQSQKEVLFTQKLNNELEEEKCKLEKKAEASSKYREQMENELIGAKNEVNSKAVQLQEQNEMFSALQRDFARQKDIIDQLMEENNRLNQHKVTLARTVESKSFDQEEKFTILGNSEESFELELDPELIKTNGNSADQAHKSLYTEICKTRPLADSSYSELIMQGDKLELKTLLEADNCRFTLRGIEQELKKTENALEVKSNQCDALEKRLAEVQAKLIESETSLKNHNQALQVSDLLNHRSHI